MFRIGQRGYSCTNTNKEWSQGWQKSLLNEKNQKQFIQSRIRLGQWNTLGRLLIIHNLQLMLENEFHLPRRSAKMVLLKLILLPRKGGSILPAPPSQERQCAFRFRNGLIWHRQTFFLLSAKERHNFCKLSVLNQPFPVLFL